MKVFTELELRDLYKDKPFTSFHLPAGTRLTPAAAQFLSDRKIALVTGEKKKISEGTGKQVLNQSKCSLKEPEKGYLVLPQGEIITEKPEYYTHLLGKTLVTKTHPRIRLRGKLDHMQARVILVIQESESSGHTEVATDLTTVLDLLRLVLKSEVLEEPMAELEFHGWSEKEIQDLSHHPEKHFGFKHFLPSPKHGKLMAQLNLLRTLARETEIVALEAFYHQDYVEREDILQALNRLSSILYIMMCRFISGGYLIARED